jgi:hypothetical protein
MYILFWGAENGRKGFMGKGFRAGCRKMMLHPDAYKKCTLFWGAFFGVFMVGV